MKFVKIVKSEEIVDRKNSIPKLIQLLVSLNICPYG